MWWGGGGGVCVISTVVLRFFQTLVSHPRLYNLSVSGEEAVMITEVSLKSQLFEKFRFQVCFARRKEQKKKKKSGVSRVGTPVPVFSRT